MLLSIALILTVGMSAGWLCKKLGLPGLLGMLLTGILLGPYVLNQVDDSILSISSELRRIALIIILTRAGLSLNINDFKKMGRPAILMCFLPACFEILGMILLAPKFLGISILDAAILGAVIAAVSPAVIVPKMLKLMEERRGIEKGIPQLILAGASVDDVFVIVMFYAFTGLAQGDSLSPAAFAKIPVSILVGCIIGLLLGYLFANFFEKMKMRDTSKALILLSLSFFLVTIEDRYSSVLTFSSLIAVMCVGIGLHQTQQPIADRLSIKFQKLWVPAEVMLFVLVGATVNPSYIEKAGILVVALLFIVLLIRMLGVFICLLGTNLNRKERLFCMISYTPKATVQAAIGGIPLAMGLSCGDIVLTVAVLSIIITAPLGALVIDKLGKRVF